MVFVLQVNQVATGVNGLNHAAADCSGESSEFNKGAVSPRWLMREVVGLEAGTKTAHRPSDIQGLGFSVYSDCIRRC